MMTHTESRQTRTEQAPDRSGAPVRPLRSRVSSGHVVMVVANLAAGDRIDVLASSDDGARAGYVLAEADVVAVHASTSGPLRAGDGQITITVAVDAVGAQRLASALHGDHLLVVRATGAPA